MLGVSNLTTATTKLIISHTVPLLGLPVLKVGNHHSCPCSSPNPHSPLSPSSHIPHLLSPSANPTSPAFKMHLLNPITSQHLLHLLQHPATAVQTCSVSHPTTSSSLHSDLWPSLLLSPHLQVQSPGSRRSVMRSLYSPLFKTLQWLPSMLSTHTKAHPLAYQTKHEPALAHSVQPTDHP